MLHFSLRAARPPRILLSATLEMCERMTFEHIRIDLSSFFQTPLLKTVLRWRNGSKHIPCHRLDSSSLSSNIRASSTEIDFLGTFRDRSCPHKQMEIRIDALFINNATVSIPIHHLINYPDLSAVQFLLTPHFCRKFHHEKNRYWARHNGGPYTRWKIYSAPRFETWKQPLLARESEDRRPASHRIIRFVQRRQSPDMCTTKTILVVLHYIPLGTSLRCPPI